MPIYEYCCGDCQAVTSVLAPMSRANDPCPCEGCGSARTHRIVSRPSVPLSNFSKVERLDPKYDKMVDRAMQNTRDADPDRLINRRGGYLEGAARQAVTRAS